MTDAAIPSVLDRRSFSLRDFLMLLGMLGGLTMLYIKISSRLAVIETKVEMIGKQMDRMEAAAPPR